MIIDLDKNELAKYIPDSALCESIFRHIDFIETYIDKVDSSFSDDAEKKIAYKQLLIMAFSSLEAIWKGVAAKILQHCDARGCTEDCPYRPYRNYSQINSARAMSVFMHLQATRLLFSPQDEYKTLKMIAGSRNHVHLFRQTVKKMEPVFFDKNTVEDCLQLFYETVDRLSIIYDYCFGEEGSCLKELDGDCYKENKAFIENLYAQRYSFRAYSSCTKLFYNKPLSNDDLHFLSIIKNGKTEEFDGKMFVGYLGMWLCDKSKRFNNNEDYNIAIASFFKKLERFLTNKEILFKLKEEINRDLEKYTFPLNEDIERFRLLF